MKRLAAICGAVALLLMVFSESGYAVDFAKPVGYVNDFAGILSQEQVATLEQTLKSFDEQTSNQVVVAIVPSFQGLDRFTYSQDLFTAWGIGQKSKNNGVLFLIGPKEDFPFPERGEAFINVGKGLEGALPDSVAGSILRNDVFPQFQDKKYYEGITYGVQDIISATKGEYTAEPNAKNQDSSLSLQNKITFGFWFGLIFLSYLGSFLARSKSWWMGGVLGGVGGAVLGFIFFAGTWILLSAVGLSLVGLLFDYIVSKNYQTRLKQGKPTDFWHSGGGFWFGGGRGGFGGGGGGFGGFGGGGSGGGGAGGSW